MSRCNKTIRGCDNFPGNSQGLQAHNQSQGSINEQGAVFQTKVIAKSLLELLMVFAFIGQPFALPDIF
jgi:hypothetical protein